jgi:hypothetical protein
MNAFELIAAIEAIQKAKEDLTEAIQNAAADEEFLGALAILSDECAEFHELYEKESQKLPKLRGAAW